MHITVFGGSSPKPGEPAYENAYRLGRWLGERGHTVLTGGYIGTMEAVSRGAAEAGGHVVGVTCEEIERWRAVGVNAWVHEEVRCATLLERLRELIFRAHAALALPGGPGTLTEIALTWNLTLIQALPPRPLILIGVGWQRTFQTFFAAQQGYIQPAHRELLTFVPDVDQAIRLLAA